MDPYNARFYDRYFVGVEGDAEFYVKAARQAGAPVLELGCGTGRILLPIARAGIRVVGLELADPLLAVARRKLAALGPRVRQRVALVQGDMVSFSLDQRFRLAIIPYRTFQHLLTPVDQKQALDCIYDHLEDGGTLVFNIFDPLSDMVEQGFSGTLRKDTDFVDPDTGRRVTVWYCRQYDPQDQLLEQELIFEEVDQDERVVDRTCGRLVLRYAARYEMEYLLERCGFAVEALYGDFQGNPYPGYGEQVWVARKRA
jgi:SAM-dependent methyltransferase